MRRISVFLLGCFLVLAVLPGSVSAEEGEFRVGVVSEYVNNHYGKGGTHLNSYGTGFGFLLGYEKPLSDKLWYALDGKVVHSPAKTTVGITGWRNTDVRAIAKLGTVFHRGVDIKPFLGVGVNYMDRDIRGGNDEFFTDYFLPVGVSVEENTDYGLIGGDIRYEYVVHRERYCTEAAQTGRIKTFGGNSNVEVGLRFEPKNFPIGFRPYYRYEHANYKQDGWWPSNRNIGGLEIYYRF